MDGGGMQPPLVVSHGQETLDLGGEVEGAGAHEVVERLLAGVIADEQTALPRIVPHRDREHAEEARGELGAPILVEMRDDLGVRPRAEVVTLGFKRGTELGEVVELAVLCRPDGPGLIRERLAPAFDVEDAEAPGAQREAGTRDQELVVRSAIGDTTEHHLDGGGVGLAEDAGDATHG